MAHRLLSLTELSRRGNDSIHQAPKGRCFSGSAVGVVIVTTVDDAVGASKGNVVGISPLPLWSFDASTMLLLTLKGVVMDLKRLDRLTLV